MFVVLLLLSLSQSCHAFAAGPIPRASGASALWRAPAPLAAPLMDRVACQRTPAALRTSAARAPAVVMQKKSKKDVLELEGVVLEALPNANFRVQLDDTEQVILAHVSGKIRKNFIKILVGDHVTCEISPYDLTKGRITFRRR
jgi:translation initiation factor IF-1